MAPLPVPRNQLIALGLLSHHQNRLHGSGGHNDAAGRQLGIKIEAGRPSFVNLHTRCADTVENSKPRFRACTDRTTANPSVNRLRNGSACLEFTKRIALVAGLGARVGFWCYGGHMQFIIGSTASCTRNGASCSTGADTSRAAWQKANALWRGVPSIVR